MATKTRRRQAKTLASNDPDNSSTPNELYENGEAAAALKVLLSSSQQTSSSSKDLENYNRLLLSYMTNGTAGSTAGSTETTDSSNNRATNFEAMASELEAWENKFRSKQAVPKVSAKKRTRNEWIAVYNRSLLLLSGGDILTSYRLCADKLKAMIKAKKMPLGEMSLVASRMAFLLLECILTFSLASHSGLRPVGDSDDLTAEVIVAWLEMQDPEAYPQFKFLLALYKSRLDFAERDQSGKHVDSKIRSARKELKTAMEVFQHKLRPSASGEESLASSWEADSDVHNNNETASQNHHQSNNNTPIMSAVLQKQNQAALNLKANVEQIKGNPKKSLILCGEALTASTEEDPFYDAMHANNLALVYETNSRRHLAMHAVAKALRVDLQKPTNFQPDGTARPDPSLVTLYNSALCSLQARNFLSAYDCMHTCVQHSKDLFAQRPRCWLLLAEACIGIHATTKYCRKNMFTAVEVEGEPKGVVLRNALGYEIAQPESLEGSTKADGLDYVKQYPLLRAKGCLETALEKLDQVDKQEREAMASARLSMAYVSLELRDFETALRMSRLVIEESVQQQKQSGSDPKIIELRRAATARMYASEAASVLGDASEGMRFLVGDGQGDAFDRLASDLGGVTMEVAASNGKGRTRLARAQSMVRSSASVASAVSGNLSAAKQLAMSAQSMEDAYSSSREQSTARRALVYCMLREGNNSTALTLLRSLT